MRWLSLELIKLNSRIDTDYEDELLTIDGNSAEQQVLNDTRRTYEELVNIGGGTFPADLMQASLFLVDAAYHFRCPVTQVQQYAAVYNYEKLVKPYMRLDGDDETN